MFDVAVIGAGVTGAFIARELTRYELSVGILERENDVAMGATKANSAIVHAGFDALPGTWKAKLNVAGAAMFENVCRELGVKYRRCGALVLAVKDEEKETLRALKERGERNGVQGLALLGGDEARALEPSLSPHVVAALHAPSSAITCPYELTIAAVGNAMDNGAQLLCGFEVASVRRENGAYRLTSAGGETVEARYVVNAAGLYADAVAAMAGDRSFRLSPRRGEYLLLDKECGGTVSHTLFRVPTKMGKGILVTPTVDGNLLAGPTSEDVEDREDRATTSEGLGRIMRETAVGVPAMPFGRVITSFAGLRAVPDGGDFIIRESDVSPGFFHAAGIESPGLSSAPAIGRYVADLFVRAGVRMEERKDFCPTREPDHAFREMSTEEKNAVIARDPRYGRIVCRCEGISEGEIVRAVHVNPPARDLDAVKRRTRSGMGRCQGGFCSPLVTEILARELNIPITEVTRSGGGSRLFAGRTK